MNSQTIRNFGGDKYNQILLQVYRHIVDHKTSAWLWFPKKGMSEWAGADNGDTDCARTYTWNDDGSLSMNVDYFSDNYRPEYMILVNIYGLKSPIVIS